MMGKATKRGENEQIRKPNQRDLDRRKGTRRKKSVQPVPHTINQEVEAMQYEIVNYIELTDGRTICLDSEPPEAQRRYGAMIQDRMMGALGYRRREAKEKTA